MPWKEPSERHSDDLIAAIDRAAHKLAHSFTEGFKLMAAAVNAETQAIADLQSAITDVGTAIATEIVALQAAMNAQGVNNSPAIEASVQKIKDLTSTLNNSLAAPPPPPPPVVPVLTSISPNNGPVTGGTKVVLTGTGFTGATAVSFSSIPATGFIVNSDTQITATAPPGATGTLLPVLVTTPSGVTVVNTLWTYGTAAVAGTPTITALSPTSGTAAGGTSVTLAGSGFTGATKVTFGGIAAASFSVTNDTTIVAVAPASPAGVNLPVVVTTPNGVSVAGPTWAFV
jgi:IPT/TIG domain